jgi:hypothetical protein
MEFSEGENSVVKDQEDPGRGKFRLHLFLHCISIVLLLLLVTLLVVLRKDPSPKCEMRQLHRSVAHRFCRGPSRCSPSSATVEESGDGGTLAADAVQETDCFPHWTNYFPVHWAFYPPSLLSDDGSCTNSKTTESDVKRRRQERVILPGNYGTGTQEVADWIGDWLLLDRTLQHVPSFGTTDLHQLQGMRLQLVEYALSRYFPHFIVTVIQVPVSKCRTGDEGSSQLLRSMEGHGKVDKGHVAIFVEEGQAAEREREKKHRSVLVVRINLGAV